jgi:Mg2+ and Co2+ transporter CorA
MDMTIKVIQEVGFPIAASVGLGWFIYKLIMRIVDGMETKLDNVDEKVESQIAAIEDRLGTKLDSQHGILVALIDRVRSLDNEIIRQDTMIKTILGVPQLINIDKLAKADRDDQRKD